MQKAKNNRFFWVFALLWGGLTIWNLITPTAVFSKFENRYLASFPDFSVKTLLNGEFMEDVTDYLNEQFAGRPYWVGAQTAIEYGLGKRVVNDTYLAGSDLMPLLSPEDPKISAANIEGIRALSEATEIPVYFMLVPSAASVQESKLPAFAEPWDEQAYISDVYASLSGEVQPIDAFRCLKEHEQEYIYYHTDHHWTTYGASLAYQEMCAVMGLPTVSKEEYRIRTASDHFLGTLHSRTGFPLVKPDTIEVYERGSAASYEIVDGDKTINNDTIYDPDYLNGKDQYSYFLGQLNPFSTITTNAESGERLLLFKDSYSHCLLPMMFEQFSEIRLIDLRYMLAPDYNAYIDFNRYDKILFLYSTDVFAHQNGASNLKGRLGLEE